MISPHKAHMMTRPPATLAGTFFAGFRALLLAFGAIMKVIAPAPDAGFRIFLAQRGRRA
jgi:hypothetical protein